MTVHLFLFIFLKLLFITENSAESDLIASISSPIHSLESAPRFNILLVQSSLLYST